MKRLTTKIKLISMLALTAFAIQSVSYAQSRDTVYVSDFGASANSYENAVTNIQRAINECKKTGAKVLSFSKGRYDIWPEGAVRLEYFVSNTSTEQECPSKIKTIGLHFFGIKNLTVEGNGAMLMFHGKMVTIAVDNCDNVTIKNLSTDFERPTASELTFTKVDDKGVEVKFHKDTRYDFVNGKIALIGEGWKSKFIHSIELDCDDETFRYSGQNWKALAEAQATEISEGVVRFATPSTFKPKVGNTLTLRDIIRDQVGMFIVESNNITLQQINMHYMHGLGIVSQFVNNITMDRVNCSPREENGRKLAASADMMHFSGCRGKVSILGCNYLGAQDDPINVHGTNLRIVEKIDDKTLKLRFMHGQSYGFDAFFPEDEVAFVKAKTMERYATNYIESVERISDREVEVKLKNTLPDFEINLDCIENITWTPELEVRNCRFARTSTRGLLVTTPRKVLIENNLFYKTGMSAILIEGDAEGWFESGPVTDITIRNNTFIDCAYQGGPGNAIIAMHPSNTVIDANKPVHRNITIENNTFKTFDYPILYAKSTANLVFRNNKIEHTNTLKPSSGNKYGILLRGCKDVVIQGNTVDGDVLGKTLKIENMKKNYVKFSKEFSLVD